MLLFNLQQYKNKAVKRSQERSMPKVTNPKTGKTRHFKYTEAGVKMAKEYAKASNGKFSMGSPKDVYRKKKK